MRDITKHLSWQQDTCSIYAVRGNEGSLLIDCGTCFRPSTDDALMLPEINHILLTHFHRDQTAAAAEWQRQGTAITVPFVERRFVEEADILRASYDIFNNYNSYYPCYGPLENVVADAYAFDYEKFNWDGLTFEVVPLPGHTFGSVGYLFEIDNKRVLACGDLLSSSCSMRDYFWTQWRYMDFQGHVNQMESLETVAALQLDFILPGHGEPFAADLGTLTLLLENMKELWEMFHGRPYEPYKATWRQISDHVFETENVQACSYLVRDDAGHGLLIDCGYSSGAPIAANPHRYIDRLTPFIEEQTGVHTIEYFLPTHYHDDHLAGFAALRARYGTKAVASTITEDLLQHPQRYDMPCLIPRGVDLAQVVHPGDAFVWRGLRFVIDAHPGQTRFDQHIRFTVDGQTFVAIGDAISGLCFKEKRDHIHSFIPKNRTPLSDYSSVPAHVNAHNADVLLTGHGGAVSCDRDMMDRWGRWMGRWQKLFLKTIDRPDTDQGMDPRWVEFYPYKVRIQPGDVQRFHIWVTNHSNELADIALQFRSVSGVEIDPPVIQLQIESNEKMVSEIRVAFPSNFCTHSLPVVADVTWKGENLGEIAEAIAYW